MYQEITLTMFHDAFRDSAEHVEHGFSYDGLSVLYEFITEQEYESGIPIEFDLVAIRCDFTEYPSLDAAAADYCMHTEELAENTTVLALPDSDGVIIQNF